MRVSGGSETQSTEKPARSEKPSKKKKTHGNAGNAAATETKEAAAPKRKPRGLIKTAGAAAEEDAKVELSSKAAKLERAVKAQQTEKVELSGAATARKKTENREIPKTAAEKAEAPVTTLPKKQPPAGASPKDDVQDRELKEAEILMDHVNSGRLPPAETKSAMGRIGEIVKKYGKA